MPALGLACGIPFRSRSLSAIDPAAKAFFAAQVAAGQTLSATEKTAINSFVLALKATPTLWTKLSPWAVYPYVGGTATSCSFNLMNPAAFQMTWNGAGLGFSSNGVQGDGSGFGDTGINAQTLGFQLTMSFYQRTNNSAGSIWRFMGATDGFASVLYFLDRFNDGGVNRFFSGTNVNVTEGQRLQLVTSCKTANDIFKVYGNATEIGSDASAGSATPPSVSHFVLAANTGSGAVDIPTNAQFALHAFGVALSPTEVSAWSSAVTNFQTALGRNV